MLVDANGKKLFMRLALVFGVAVALIVICGDAPRAGSADRRLDIYWIDVEGGGATLIVTPAGESILIDAGNPGGRDPQRIHRVATEVAKLTRIDHLVVTHYHVDHFGGVAELAGLMPIGNLYEGGIATAAEAERTEARLEPYKTARVERTIIVKPGDSIALKPTRGAATTRFRFIGARQEFVSTRGNSPNASRCAASKTKEADTTDNANSLVSLLEFGDFRFFDGGDLTWNLEGRLVCPSDRVGPVDVYQSDHHGLDVSNNPVLIQTLQPRVIVFNNGPRKGLEKDSAAAAQSAPSVEAIYQVHRNVRDGAWNTALDLIANQDEQCAGEHIKLSAAPDGESYTITVASRSNARTFKTVGAKDRKDGKDRKDTRPD